MMSLAWTSIIIRAFTYNLTITKIMPCIYAKLKNDIAFFNLCANDLVISKINIHSSTILQNHSRIVQNNISKEKMKKISTLCGLRIKTGFIMKGLNGTPCNHKSGVKS
jgi:hypothetical protein